VKETREIVLTGVPRVVNESLPVKEVFGLLVVDESLIEWNQEFF